MDKKSGGLRIWNAIPPKEWNFEDYNSGKLLSGELKAILIEKINEFLKIHQEKREKAKQQIEQFLLQNK